MSGISYGATTISTGINLSAGNSPAVAAVPKGLIVTRAVELQEGWVGQVIVADLVVKEKPGFETGAKAEKWATGHVVSALRRLFK